MAKHFPIRAPAVGDMGCRLHLGRPSGRLVNDMGCDLHLGRISGRHGGRQAVRDVGCRLLLGRSSVRLWGFGRPGNGLSKISKNRQTLFKGLLVIC